MKYVKVSTVGNDLRTKKWLEEEITSDDCLQLIGSYQSTDEAIINILHTKPDIVILSFDTGIPPNDITSCIFKLKSDTPDLKILLITSLEDNNTVFDAIKAGVTGYILKDDLQQKKMVNLLHEIEEGGAPMSSRIAQKLILSFQKSSHGVEQHWELTPKETQILELLLGGHRNKEIADKFNISEGTVKVYTHNIYRKMAMRVSQPMKVMRSLHSSPDFNTYRQDDFWAKLNTSFKSDEDDTQVWNKSALEQFFEGYAESDSIYDDL